MRTLDRLRSHPKVKHVDDERAIGNGVIVTLRYGWHFDPADHDNRVRGEDTVTEALASVRAARRVPSDVHVEPDADDDLPSPRP